MKMCRCRHVALLNRKASNILQMTVKNKAIEMILICKKLYFANKLSNDVEIF